MKRIITVRASAIILAVLFLISVIPVVILGLYASPVADDLSYGSTTASVVASGRPLVDIISAAAEQTGDIYQQWQGSFSAVFLMALQPGVFGEEYYFLTTIIMLGSIVLGTLLFLRELLMKWFGADVWQYLLISSVVLIMKVHFCYYPAETFYWYNGGIYYAFFYSLSLILASMMLCVLRTENKVQKAILTLCSVLLCGFIGGGNYTTALSVMLILALVSAVLITKKDRGAIITLIVFAVGTAMLLLSILSEGNGVRQESVGGSTNPVVAVILSVILGGYIFLNSLSVPVLIGFVCITPILYMLAKRSKFEFKHPLWFTAISFGVFCAQCTPPIYGLGIAVPERLLNIVYFSFYIFMLLNIFVWCGYISHRYESKFENSFFKAVKNNSTAVFVAMVVLFAGTAIGSCDIGKDVDGSAKISGLPLGVEAVYELINGEAEAYREVNTKRLTILNNTEIKDAVLTQYTQKPYLLFINDVTYDTSDWRNEAMARYYNKNSVVRE